MTDETIRPALTPAEWDRALTGKVTVGHLTGRLMRDDRGDRHAVAALCLANQPFGFTRADIALLERCRATVGWRHEEEVDSLAARIAALVPAAP